MQLLKILSVVAIIVFSFVVVMVGTICQSKYVVSGVKHGYREYKMIVNKRDDYLMIHYDVL